MHLINYIEKLQKKCTKQNLDSKKNNKKLHILIKILHKKGKENSKLYNLKKV